MGVEPSTSWWSNWMSNHTGIETTYSSLSFSQNPEIPIPFISPIQKWAKARKILGAFFQSCTNEQVDIYGCLKFHCLR